jgi:beta-glucanase (GH16 family)
MPLSSNFVGTLRCIKPIYYTVNFTLFQFAPLLGVRFFRSWFFAGILLSTFAISVHAANVLLDPGFEATPGGVETNAVDGWATYGTDNNTLTETSSTIAHTGSNYFKVYQNFSGSVNYDGVYQDIPAQPGDAFTASGWVRTSSGDTLAGGNEGWIEITFRDSNANAIALYRTALMTTDSITAGSLPVDTWINLAVTNQYDPNTFTNTGPATSLVAPTNTTFVRCQIVFQGDANYSGGSLYFDDIYLTKTTAAPTNVATAWNIVWNDEFSGSAINTNHWQFETGNGSGGWGNNELEYYTSRPQNAYVSNGILHIVAIKESYNNFNYTSARMKTENQFSKTYGRFEFRAKLPQGQGYWPALWLFPQSSYYGSWAASGEIDVMENMGSNPTSVLGTIHYGAAYPNQTQSYGPAYTFPSGDSVTNWHVYEVDWTTNSINWLVDGQVYETQTSWWSSSNPTNTNIRNPYPAPFDQPFYLIMNVAVGGNFDGNPNGTTVFPGEMQVDYVRVYDLTAPLQLSLAKTNSNLTLSWPANIVCHLQAQTNFTGALSSNWTDLPVTNGPYTLPATPATGSVFYRLASP